MRLDPGIEREPTVPLRHTVTCVPLARAVCTQPGGQALTRSV